MSGFSTSLDSYGTLIQAPELLMIWQATSVSLTFSSFHDEDKIKRHLVQYTKSWQGKDKLKNCVFL
jgi:hypothetical protein